MEASLVSGDAIPSEETGIDRFQRRPVIDRIDARTLALIQKTIADGCTAAEIGHFLELCAHYELDPFAREAWIAKSRGGKLLIMVGRDGLRKIAQRNGLHVDGDVVREHDEFHVVRTPDGNRTIAHSYDSPTERGAIIGAWTEVRSGGPLGLPMGYFYAPLEEYKPSGASEHSPWSKQVGVMILAAAERQAIRQATPLGGLLAIGEDEVVSANERGAIDGLPGGVRPIGPAPRDDDARLQGLIASLPIDEPLKVRALTAVRKAGWAIGATEMRLLGLSPDAVVAEIEQLEWEQSDAVPDAVEVVSGAESAHPATEAPPGTYEAPGSPTDLEALTDEQLADWVGALVEWLGEDQTDERRNELAASLDLAEAETDRRSRTAMAASGQGELSL